MTRELILLGSLACGLPLSGGQIFGTLTEGGKAVAKGVEVVIDCSGEQVKGTIDSFGAYRVNVQKTGRCTLTLTYKGQKLAATIASLSEPASADFELQVQDGKYKLIRR
jgi:sRNA-binding regulator protein Hfq